MALQRFKTKVTPEWSGLRLDHVLSDWIPKVLGEPISRARVRALVIAGGVYLNRKRVRIASKQLIIGAEIEVFIDREKIQSPATADYDVPPLSDKSVLFEDDYLIVINKPAGMPTQPTLDSARANLFEAVKKLRPLCYIGLHHRLDRDTSGLVLFTKKKEVNGAIARLFQEHQIQKTYLALVSGPAVTRLNTQWTVTNYLKVRKDAGKKNRVVSVKSGGDRAITEFELEKVFQSNTTGQPSAACALVRARPLTGRMHQIRVHLSEGKTPILGDPFYGGSAQLGGLSIPRVMLHARQLDFLHPVDQRKVSIQSEIPEDFEKCLKQLQR